jgi:hypothetical protein
LRGTDLRTGPTPEVPAGTFTAASNGDGTYTLAWSTPGLERRYVEALSPWIAGQLDAQVADTLIPGGKPSGSAVTPVLSAAQGPYELELWCAGSSATAAHSIMVSS